jgi:hypothetical protein
MLNETGKTTYLNFKHQELESLIKYALTLFSDEDRSKVHKKMELINLEVLVFLLNYHKISELFIIKYLISEEDIEFANKIGYPIELSQKTLSQSNDAQVTSNIESQQELTKAEREINAGTDYHRFFQSNINYLKVILKSIGEEGFREGVAARAEHIIKTDPNAKKILDEVKLRRTKELISIEGIYPDQVTRVKGAITILDHYIENYKKYKPVRFASPKKEAVRTDKEKTLSEIWQADITIYNKVVECLLTTHPKLKKPFLFQTSNGLEWRKFHGSGYWAQALIQTFLKKDRMWIKPNSAPVLKSIFKNTFNFDVDLDYLKETGLQNAKDEQLAYFNRLFRF